MCLGGPVAVFTLIGTAVTGHVVASATTGATVGALVLAMALFDRSREYRLISVGLGSQPGTR
jgi:hypothetical protein